MVVSGISICCVIVKCENVIVFVVGIVVRCVKLKLVIYVLRLVLFEVVVWVIVSICRINFCSYIVIVVLVLMMVCSIDLMVRLISILV